MIRALQAAPFRSPLSVSNVIYCPKLSSKFCLFSSSSSISNSKGLPKPPLISDLITEKDNQDAFNWVSHFSGAEEKKVPRDLVELSFSRSSGPGGQNVNKVNTKATVRCSLNETWIPRWALPALQKTPYYVASTHSILITSSVHRSQSQNIEECLQKFHALILSTASASIKKGPSEEKKKKVGEHIKMDKIRRKMDKIKRSGVKEGRRGGGRGAFDF